MRVLHERRRGWLKLRSGRIGFMEAPEDTSPLATLECVVLDCPDPAELAAFYRVLLGGSINQPDPRWAVGKRWATLHTPTGQVLAFQAVDDYVPPRWPDPAHPQQFHLDFHVKALEPAHLKVLDLGAELLKSARGWRVYADPAGHPFCLVGN
jgi:catechol 2,3-dioxygenase-like lactoylglutathione lyase family enzyme